MNCECTEPMNCKEVKLFLPLFVLDGQGMTLDEFTALSNHIQSCPRCAKEYKETKFVTALIQSQHDNLIRKGIFSEPDPKDVRRELTDEENLQEIWDKVQRYEARKQHNRRTTRMKVFFKASAAIAACFVICTFGWLALMRSDELANHTQQQVSITSRPSIKVELLLDDSKTVIPTGQEISTSGNELKTLLINGKHRMVLNSDTTLKFELLMESSRLGCLAKLTSGEIYTHVEYDGNAFVIGTTHGRAVITGTTFDVKVTDDSTTLGVTEGNVQFESEEGFVEVTAGQISKIVSQSAPTVPTLCNITELTSWITDDENKTTLAKIEPYSDTYSLDDLELSINSGPINLESIDYENWVEQKRDWFKKQFPWILQLKDALAKEGIEVDYPELLTQSGDAWQFAYIETLPDRFSALNFDSLLKTASDYGFDKQWLLENVIVAKYAMENPVLSKNSPTGLKAFEEWKRCFENVQKSSKELDYDTLWHSFHASVYLTETRSLIWFAVRNGTYRVTDKIHSEALALLLQKEIKAARICRENILQMFYEQNPSPCGGNCHVLMASLIENLKAIQAIERKTKNAVHRSHRPKTSGFRQIF